MALLGFAATAAAQPKGPSGLPAQSWLLVEAESGDVLAARRPARQRSIASATKLMTARIALSRLQPSDEVIAPGYDGGPLESLLGLQAGETVSVRDLLYGLLLASGNDAAIALALRVSGSESDFVARMNAVASRLGLDKTAFTDPIGLDAGNVSSARDLVALAIELRTDPLFRRIVDTPRVTLEVGGKTRKVVNRNNLVREFPFVNGVKTGATLDAGYVLVGSARRRGVQFVSVVLGARGEAERDAATLKLLRYGSSLYRQRELVAKGEQLASLPLGDERGSLALVAAKPVKVIARPDQRPDVEFDEPPPPAEAVARGQSFGTATVTLDGRRVGAVALVAARAITPPADDDSGLRGWALLALAAVGGMAIVLAVRAIVIARRGPR